MVLSLRVFCIDAYPAALWGRTDTEECGTREGATTGVESAPVGDWSFCVPAASIYVLLTIDSVTHL